MRDDIAFASDGLTLRGWLYRPEGAKGARPAIVMAHGFSATKELFLDEFARAFAAAGFVVLAYDHRNFGASDGEPRGEIDPVAQIRGYRDAITWLQTQAGVDPARIGAWGSSYSGGHVIVLAAIDRRVKCVVAQVPIIDGYRTLKLRGAEMLELLRPQFDADRAARYRGQAPMMVPVVPETAGGLGALSTPDSIDFFLSHKDRTAGWRNEVTLRSLEYASQYSPGLYAPRIAPTPFLLVVAKDDALVPSEFATQAFESAGEPKKLVMLDCGHFAPYTGAMFETVSREETAWFVEHLKP